MITNKKRGCKRQYEYGGTGIFDTLLNLGTKLFTSNIAKRVASSALDVGKSVAKEGAKKALEAGKSAAVNAVSGLVKKALNRKSEKILRKYAALPETRDNNALPLSTSALIHGNGKNAIAIEKLIKKLNRGSGIKTI